MKIAIDCVHYPISKNLASHRASWAKYWKYYLETKGNTVDILYRNEHDKWSEYDAIYLYQGMEFNGKLNLAGGVGEWHIQRFEQFASWMNNHKDIPVYSIEHEMPDYYELLQGRKIDIPSLYGVTDRVKKAELPSSSEQIVLGDSHSLSAMLPRFDEFVRVNRTDFKTLNGAIKDGFDNLADFSKAKYASFYFGSIDARHHVLRHYSGPAEAAYELSERYATEINRVKIKNDLNVEVVGLLPMTKDSRKLPKSGFYDGTPFYGDLKDRIEFIDTFNYYMMKTCNSMGWDFFLWPAEFIDEDGTLNESFMEKPRSVHMSQKAYRYDLENNKVRYA